jgi:hypothetical protein
MTAGRNRAILVTGSVRSGSTWVGNMIALHPGIYYVSEPFNTDRPNCPARYRFHYVTADDEAAFRTYLRPNVEFRYPLSELLWHGTYPEGRLPILLRSAKHLYRRLAGYRPLLKDPHALFSSEWLSRTYAMDVVVLIRHPAAFVSSMKRLGWQFCFNHFLEQSQLMSALLGPWEADMRRLVSGTPSPVENIALMWRVIHGVIREFQRRHPEWIFVRHEDLSQNPVPEYRRLFERLGLRMTPALERAVAEHSSEENPREARPGVVHLLKRDSRAGVWNWRTRLTPSEVTQVRRATEDVAAHFYADADWDGGKSVAA